MLIGVDWGTTNLRAHLIDDGRVTQTVRSESGLMSVPPGGFEDALAAAIAPLRAVAPDAPVVMSGMVGSRQGWVEAPYVAPPAGLSALAAQMVTVDAPTIGDVALIPGVAVGQDGGVFADVMRGEETEVFGALSRLGVDTAVMVLPGTHSKWVSVEGGAITGFRTYLTGDAYGALLNHTILSKFRTDLDDPAAFEDGLDLAKGLETPGDLLTRLFSIRAEILMGRFQEHATPSTLSGLLIGAELLSGTAHNSDIVIIGSSPLAHTYAHACTVLGIYPTVVRDEVAPLGQMLIASERA